MKKDEIYVGEYDEKKSKRGYILLKGIQVGAFTGIVSGALFGLSIAMYVLIGVALTKPGQYPPGDKWDYASGVPYYFMFFTLVGIAVGVIFGLGFVRIRWGKTQFYKRLVRDWMVAWTMIFCIGNIIAISLIADWSLLNLWMIVGFVITGLIGGYVGSKRFDRI